MSDFFLKIFMLLPRHKTFSSILYTTVNLKLLMSDFFRITCSGFFFEVVRARLGKKRLKRYAKITVTIYTFAVCM